MAFDIEMIRKIYGQLPGKVAAARTMLGRPLTLAEKVLYAHAYETPSAPYTRGKDYVNFSPDRVAMQDATAQMALLQFSTCGRDKVAVKYGSLRSPDTGESRCECRPRYSS